MRSAFDALTGSASSIGPPPRRSVARLLANRSSSRGASRQRRSRTAAHAAYPTGPALGSGGAHGCIHEERVPHCGHPMFSGGECAPIGGLQAVLGWRGWRPTRAQIPAIAKRHRRRRVTLAQMRGTRMPARSTRELPAATISDIHVFWRAALQRVGCVAAGTRRCSAVALLAWIAIADSAAALQLTARGPWKTSCGAARSSTRMAALLSTG